MEPCDCEADSETQYPVQLESGRVLPLNDWREYYDRDSTEAVEVEYVTQFTTILQRRLDEADAKTETKREQIRVAKQAFFAYPTLDQCLQELLDTTAKSIKRIERKEHEKLRDEVLARDNHQCQRTGCETQSSLHTHHRDGIRGHNERANVVTMCEEHHIQFEQEQRLLVRQLHLERIGKPDLFSGAPANADEARLRVGINIASQMALYGDEVSTLTTEFLNREVGPLRQKAAAASRGAPPDSYRSDVADGE